jgi:hypothetical protein
MSLRTTITDGTGTKVEAKVTTEHALLVTQQARSAAEIPTEELTRTKLFFDYFTRVSDGSRDMTVDGSVTPQEFILTAGGGSVRWIEYIRIIIEGNNFALSASGDFRRWGSVATAPGLVNGTELFVVQGGVETPIFFDPVHSMGDLFNYQTDYDNFVNAVDAQADFLSIDIAMPAAVALPLGVEDRLVARVNDDLVDADFLTFRILARGYQEIIA